MPKLQLSEISNISKQGFHVSVLNLDFHFAFVLYVKLDENGNVDLQSLHANNFIEF